MAKGDWKKDYPGKGSMSRPLGVDQAAFDENWERTFGRNTEGGKPATARRIPEGVVTQIQE